MAINPLNNLGIAIPGLQIPGQGGIAPANKPSGEGGLGGIGMRGLSEVGDSAPAVRPAGLDGLRAESQSIASSQGLLSINRGVFETIRIGIREGRDIAEEARAMDEPRPALADRWQEILQRLEGAFGNAELDGVNLFTVKETQVAITIQTPEGTVEINGFRQVVEKTSLLFNTDPADPANYADTEAVFADVEATLDAAAERFDAIQAQLRAAQGDVTSRLQDAIQSIFGDLFDPSLTDNPLALANNAARGLFGQSDGIANRAPLTVGQLFGGATS
ncbi:MAG: hypothetical protein NXI16_12520 [Alphaproteobacteria bacterium]|nr:hypothetical protein [Alphaproteobacteria bacterium]